MMTRRKYTEEERLFIKSFAWGHSHQEIVAAFNQKFTPPVQVNQLRAYLKNYKILTGRSGYFKKGYVPASKGKHTGIHTSSMFGKNNPPKNRKPVGTISVRNRKNGKYVFVKIADPDRWKMQHVLEWEKYNGRIPRGKVILFLDGNTLNTDISNLMLIERKVHVRMNQLGLRYQDPNSTRTGAYVAELVTKIAEAKKR